MYKVKSLQSHLFVLCVELMSVSQSCLESLFNCSGVAKTNPLLDEGEADDEVEIEDEADGEVEFEVEADDEVEIDDETDDEVEIEDEDEDANADEDIS